MKINWKRVWRKFDDLWGAGTDCMWSMQQRDIQRLVNAELRGKKKGAKGERTRT